MEAQPQPLPDLAESAGRVLVVDDDRAILNVICAGLRSQGYHVDGTNDSRAAMRFLEEPPYDVLVTDLDMPEIHGSDLLRHCQERGLRTSGIVVTGFGSEQATLDALRGGAFGYISKPFRMEELRLMVRRARDHQALKQENGELRMRLAQAGRFLPPTESGGAVDLNAQVDDYEWALISEALRLANGVKSRAAELLNIKRTTLVEKIRKRGLGVESDG